MEGKLFLIPAPLGDSDIELVMPKMLAETINQIDDYIVEQARTARRFLIKAGIQKPIDELSFYILNKRTTRAAVESFLDPVKEGKNIGLISEAGLPCIADPGSEIVKIAHQKNLEVIPLVGPSSIFLALMASGMNGQKFAFSGYLPIKPPERKKQIRMLEKRAAEENETQIFIETPYRNNALIKNIISVCSPYTILCVAANLTTPQQTIKTLSIKQWEEQAYDYHKQPSVLLLYAARKK